MGQVNINPNEVYICYSAQGSEHLDDLDGDGLCNSMESEFVGTATNNPDTDDDGLSDAAEYLGMAVGAAVEGVTNGVNLHAFGVNPVRKDILIEMDYFPDFQLENEAISIVVDAFANAPTVNPDGSTGINLVIDVDDALPRRITERYSDLNPSENQFDRVMRDYFTPNREGIFRYALVANQYDGDTSSGRAFSTPSDKFLITLGTFDVPGGTTVEQAGTLMHELGHAIGLHHGGDERRNYKPNYLSIMSYSYQLKGLRRGGVQEVIDYSRTQVARVDENDLNERRAMAPDPNGSTTGEELSQYRVWLPTPIGAWVQGNANRNLDWNANGNIQGNIPPRDLNHDFAHTAHRPSQNDWHHLDISGDGDLNMRGNGFIADKNNTASSGIPRVTIVNLRCMSQDE